MEKLIAEEGLNDKLSYQEGHYLLTNLSNDITGFTDKWGIGSYQNLIGLILIFWLHDRKDSVENKRLKEAVLKELARRDAVYSNRTATRDDRRDKVAFQEAVKANQQYYRTVTDAVEDLQVKPQFEKYKKETLWKWAREVWTKPIILGRPPKRMHQK